MPIKITHIAYKYLTDADFFNINKPRDTEKGGGGQSYLDLGSTALSPINRWHEYLDDLYGVEIKTATQGPTWTVPVYNIGISEKPQLVKIYQRRANSISVASQKIHSAKSNRVLSWHPTYGFPTPIDPTIRDQCPKGLIVFLAKADKRLYSGWFLNNEVSGLPLDGDEARASLVTLLTRPEYGGAQSGIITPVELYSELTADRIVFNSAEKEVLTDTLEEINEDDQIESDIEEDTCPAQDDVRYSITSIRQRNKSAVKRLKELYRHTCQITGSEYLSPKRDGVNYTEVHHLIPLGLGGADRPENMIVLSPMIHSMLHHAAVGCIDISAAQGDGSGGLYLIIEINGTDYTIKWHPDHAKVVLKSLIK